MDVRKDCRGLGLGQQLISRAIQQAKDRGLERIELEVFASNLPAIKLYEKVGFTVEGVNRKARKLEGQYDNIIELALFI